MSEDFDPFSRDEFWRAENGLSAARGFLWAVCLSAALWALIGVAVWFYTR